MAGRVPRAQYPWWVKMGVWGLPNRGAVWLFVWQSIAAAIVVTAYMAWIRHPRWPAGLLFFFGAFMYWKAIRWVDRNGTWSKSQEPSAAPRP